MEHRKLAILTTNDKTSFPWMVQRVTGTGSEEAYLEVVAEEPLAVEVNGQRVAIMMRTPGAEKELAVGFCISEGIIGDFAAVQLVHHCGGELAGQPNGLESRNLVQISADPASVRPLEGSSAARLVRSGCGAVDVADLTFELPAATAHWTIPVRLLFSLVAVLRHSQETYRRTRGLHGASLCNTAGEEVVTLEDIGRHNAVDKVIGYCLLRHIPLGDKLIVVTGRASHEVVAKALRVGIPILASFSSPTSLAVQLADRFNLTLVGYLRSSAMNVYTHSWRLK
jgi:FdhD protein